MELALQHLQLILFFPWVLWGEGRREGIVCAVCRLLLYCRWASRAGWLDAWGKSDKDWAGRRRLAKGQGDV